MQLRWKFRNIEDYQKHIPVLLEKIKKKEEGLKELICVEFVIKMEGEK